MTLRALLLCRDAHVLGTLPRLLERAGIQVERCSGAQQAVERLGRSKYEAVVVDCDDMAGATEVLQKVRSAPSNRRALALALVKGAAPNVASGLGANFVLGKPIVAERATRVLRAAYGLMMQEHRRYHRLPSSHVVHLSYGSVLEQKAVMTDLSQGGAALRGVSNLPAQQPLRLRFSLPGETASIEAQAETTWCRGERAGVKFLKLPAASQKKLDLWLGVQMEGHDYILTTSLPTLVEDED